MTDQERITALEARIAALEARLAQAERGYHPYQQPYQWPYQSPATPFPFPPWTTIC